MIEKDINFEEIFFPHLNALYIFSYYFTSNQEDAENFVKETAVKAYHFIDSYKQETNSKIYLFQILNDIISEYRKRSKRPHSVVLDDVINYHDSEKKQYLDLDKEIFEDMSEIQIIAVLQKINIDFRTIIILHHIQDFTFEEIANILELPRGTVLSRLYQARNLLKDILS